MSENPDMGHTLLSSAYWSVPYPLKVRSAIRQTREEQARIEQEQTNARYAAERRLQLLALLVLAALVLIGTVLHAGIHNVFLPRWWRLG